MKTKHTLIIVIVMYFLAGDFPSNWKDFKAGLLGKPPVEKIEMNNKC